jgi:hypothetical protein
MRTVKSCPAGKLTPEIFLYSADVNQGNAAGVSIAEGAKNKYKYKYQHHRQFN